MFNKTSAKRRVVVTGMGAVCPLGASVEEVRSSWRKGTVAFGKVSDVLGKEVAIDIGAVAPVDQIDLAGARLIPNTGRVGKMAVYAARQAIFHADIDVADFGAEQIGTVFGVSIGDMHLIEQGYHDVLQDGYMQVSPWSVPVSMLSSACAQVSLDLGLKGESRTVSTACASSTHALIDAYEMVAQGRLTAVLAGGADSAMVWGNWKGWEALRVLDINGCRPFDKNRRGMTLGEGAVLFLLEDHSSALARGATIYGEILGHGGSSDACHITQPDVDSIARAMQSALKNSGIAPDDVDFISAHATGTVFNDKTETEAIKKVFTNKGTCPPVSATKSMHGHLLGAGGAIETLIALQALKDNLLPSTQGLTTADPDCDLDYVLGGARPADLNICMKNSFAFGGVNASVIIGGPQIAMQERAA